MNLKSYIFQDVFYLAKLGFLACFQHWKLFPGEGKKIEAFQKLKLFDIVQQLEIYLRFSGFNVLFN